MLPTLTGDWLGNRIRHGPSPEMFRRILLVGMLAIGLHMAQGLL